MECLITFPSTHNVNFAERLLIAADIAVRMMALPSAIAAGCGFCLRVDHDDLAQTLAIFASNSVDFDDAFFMDDSSDKIKYDKI